MSLFPTFAKLLATRGTDSRAPRQGLFPTLFGIFLPTSSGQRRALAELLALGLDERLPLAPLLEAWAADERGWQAARVRKLAKLVAAGMPLDAALARVRGALRPQDATALAVATTLHGNATEALAGFSAPAASTEPVERGIRWVLGYAATLLLVSLPILTFVMVKLLPMFRKILEDFEPIGLIQERFILKADQEVSITDLQRSVATLRAKYGTAIEQSRVGGSNSKWAY